MCGANWKTRAGSPQDANHPCPAVGTVPFIEGNRPRGFTIFSWGRVPCLETAESTGPQHPRNGLKHGAQRDDVGGNSESGPESRWPGANSGPSQLPSSTWPSHLVQGQIGGTTDACGARKRKTVRTVGISRYQATGIAVLPDTAMLCRFSIVKFQHQGLRPLSESHQGPAPPFCPWSPSRTSPSQIHLLLDHNATPPHCRTVLYQ